MEVDLNPKSFRELFFSCINLVICYLTPTFKQNPLEFNLHFSQCLFALPNKCNKPYNIWQCNYCINHQLNTLIIKWLHDKEAFQTTQSWIYLCCVLLQVLTAWVRVSKSLGSLLGHSWLFSPFPFPRFFPQSALVHTLHSHSSPFSSGII